MYEKYILHVNESYSALHFLGITKSIDCLNNDMVSDRFKTLFPGLGARNLFNL